MEVVLQHFSHEHALILLEEVNDDGGGEAIVCKVCWQKISAGSAFICSRNCLFFMHKLCAELPTEMKHPMHSEHPLTLQQSLTYSFCEVCEEHLTENQFSYRCSPCNFDVDIRCAVKAQHFSHKHRLILLLNEENNGKPIVCDGCSQKIAGSAYRCTNCSIYLHKLCAEQPAEMVHPMHPEHPLTLLPVAPYKDSTFECVAAAAYNNASSSKAFTYHCSPCDFDLEMSCALRAQSFEHASHKHPLSPVFSPASFQCHACGINREGISYMCNTCNFWIHEDCASLPTSFKHSSHGHPLTLIYTTPHRSYCYCDICKEKLLCERLWFYACDGCHYRIHVNCSKKTRERKFAIKVEDIDEANLIHLPMPDESVNLIDQFVKQVSLGDNNKEVIVNHFSHNHPLILFDVQGDNDLCSDNELRILNEQKNDKICNACVRQISAPFYSCNFCDFFLHKWCVDLPNELKHPCHLHQLILLEKCPDARGLFYCRGCQNSCNGFTFQCIECEFFYDVKCACLPSSIIHKVHKHPLRLREDCVIEGCAACPRNIGMFSYGCDTCNFNLHYTCALLPHTIRHRYDEHPFTLIYAPIKDGPEEYICEFCEEEIDPSWWFYHCINCDKSACAKCIYKEEKEYPSIKWGCTYNSDGHPHPLVLAQATYKSPDCAYCHGCTYNPLGYAAIAFKCEQCNIMLDPECPHP